MRLVDLGGAALERVAHRLLRGAKVFDVEVALFVEHFGVPERDRRASRPLDLQADPPDHVLAHVRDRVAGRGLEDLERRDLTGAAYRRPGWSDEQVLTVFDDLYAAPVLVDEARRRPTRLFEPGVVRLTVVDLRHQDWPRRGLPARVAPDGVLPPSPVGDDDLHQQAEAIAVDVALVVPGEVAAVPTIAERDADRVRPPLQERRDVVGLVLQALVVARPPRREHRVANSLPVDGHLVEPVARHVRARPLDVAIHGELAPQQRRRAGRLDVLRESGFDPARLPVRRLQEAHFPVGRQAPCGGRAAAVPDPHAPEVALAGTHRRTRVRDVHRLARLDDARVPEEALAVAQRAFARRHLDLVGGLHDAPRGGADLPAQARLADVYADRIRGVLRPQLRDRERSRGRRRRLLQRRHGCHSGQEQQRGNGKTVQSGHRRLQVERDSPESRLTRQRVRSASRPPGAGTRPSWPTPCSRRSDSNSAPSSPASSGSRPTPSRAPPCPGARSCRPGSAGAAR